MIIVIQKEQDTMDISAKDFAPMNVIRRNINVLFQTIQQQTAKGNLYVFQTSMIDGDGSALNNHAQLNAITQRCCFTIAK